jgi:hypothetical protein
VTSPATRWFADLHTHSRASFDSLASPEALIRTPGKRGLTHLAITDHDRIDGALEGRAIAARVAPHVTVIVGEEIKSADGDLVALFLDEAVPPGLSAEETIAAVRARAADRDPHPFDRYRGSLLKDARMERLVGMVDWVETHNARVMLGNGNQRPQSSPTPTTCPGSPCRTPTAASGRRRLYRLRSRPVDGGRLLAALPSAELVLGRASLYVRL